MVRCGHKLGQQWQRSGVTNGDDSDDDYDDGACDDTYHDSHDDDGPTSMFIDDSDK